MPSDAPMDIGIAEKDRSAIADALAHVLADSYTLYLKTHAYHWNVTGPHFQTLHTMFQTQYTELWNAIDDIAERIRALGFLAPGNYRAFSELSQIDDDDGANSAPSASLMVENLLKGHETLARSLRAAQSKAASLGDEASADLLIQRLQVSEKTAWMLRSFLQKD